MRVIALRTLRNFWKKHPETEQPLKAWYKRTLSTNWISRQDVESEFGGQIKLIKNNRARFKIKGNDFRLVIAIDYRRSWVFVKFIGTHAEYDRIDAETINIETD